MTPTLFSLFSGIGGIDLAFQQAGFEIIGQVENDDFCQRVLHKHWPHVPKWGDVRKVRGREVETRLRLRCGNPRAIDVVAGGFPCQDISIAGNKNGLDGERSGLFYELARLVGELRPRIVFLENVAHLTILGGTDVVGTLTALGYDCEWGIVPASAIGAPHQRERWFCVAYAPNYWTDWRQRQQAHNAKKRNGRAASGRSRANVWPEDVAYSNQRGFRTQSCERQVRDVPAGSGQGMVNPCRTGRKKRNPASESGGTGYPAWGFDTGGRNGQAESSLGRVFDGLSFGMDRSQFPSPPDQPQKDWEAPRTITERVPNHAKRIAALGNAVVPQVVYPFAVAIREWLEGEIR